MNCTPLMLTTSPSDELVLNRTKSSLPSRFVRSFAILSFAILAYSGSLSAVISMPPNIKTALEQAASDTGYWAGDYIRQYRTAPSSNQLKRAWDSSDLSGPIGLSTKMI